MTSVSSRESSAAPSDADEISSAAFGSLLSAQPAQRRESTCVPHAASHSQAFQQAFGDLEVPITNNLEEALHSNGLLAYVPAAQVFIIPNYGMHIFIHRRMSLQGNSFVSHEQEETVALHVMLSKCSSPHLSMHTQEQDRGYSASMLQG